MTEANQYSAPNPAEAYTHHRQNLASVKEAVSAAIGDVKTHHNKTLEQLAGEAAAKIATAASERDAGITASQQTVTEKAAIAEAARQAWLAAQADLNSAKDTHQKTSGSLTTTFNQASAKVDTETAEQTRTAEQERKAAVKAEKAKVKHARSEGRQHVIDETKALVDDKVYKTRVKTHRVANAFANVGHNLARIFGEGYNQDTGLELPASLAKRKQQAQGEAAPAEAAAPEAAPAPKAPQGPGQ